MLPCIFTLQCCHGHFLSKDGEEISSFDLSEGKECVKYRLAYIALCFENSLSGKQIREKLINIPSSIDRENIQFFSAQWFWEQWSNSYAIQVMPKRFKNFDTAQLDKSEAMKIARLRDNLFSFLNDFAAEISC